jgi:plastocyanin
MTHKKRNIVLGGACLLAFVVPACGSDDNSDSTLAPAAPAATDAAGSGDTTPTDSSAGMTISGNAFSSPTVAAGTEFTITNNDGVGHTVTDDGGAFDVDVPAGGTATLIIDNAGQYAIHCEIHSSMHGTINVT